MFGKSSGCIQKAGAWLAIVLFLAPTTAWSQQPSALADIDGDGDVRPDTDGRAILLFAFGYRNASLYQNCLGVNSTRDAEAALAYLNRYRQHFDVNGDGHLDALTDGILLVRHSAGMTGNDLVQGINTGQMALPALVEQLDLLVSTKDSDFDDSFDGDELRGGSDPLDPQSTPGNTATLQFTELAELGEYLRAGFTAEDAWLRGDDMVLDGAPELAAPGNGSVNDTISKVNIQEQGVDEADRMRSDGRYVYAIRNREMACGLYPEIDGGLSKAEDAADLPCEVPAGDVVRIMALDETGLNLTEMAEYQPDDEAGVSLSGLYLAGQGTELVMLGGATNGIDWYWRYGWYNQQTSVYFADVTNPGQPQPSAQLQFQGGLIDSRVIDDHLYLLTRFYPVQIDTEEPAPTARLLPTVQRNDEPPQPIDVDGCYVESTDNPRSSAIIAIHAIDLATPSHPVTTTCFAGEAQTLYSSTKAMYLAAADYRVGPLPYVDARFPVYEQRTLIHKLAFHDGDVEYRGSGAVPGYLADNPREAAFRFSESGNFLRVITESSQLFDFFEPIAMIAADDVAPVDDRTPVSPVLLTILEDTGNNTDLEVVANLPNQEQPEAIGLRGEHLYASRFVGDTAYLVTFRTIDPLYLIDLADPYHPAILGSLKIEGFSDYLHPVGDGLMIGIGKDAYPDEFDGDGDSRGAWYQGVQVTLFDVSNPRQPTALDRLAIGRRGTEAAILGDHLAFAGMQADADSYRFAFGVSVHDDPKTPFDPAQPWYYYPFSHHGLYRFEVNTVPDRISDATLEMLPPLVTTSDPFDPAIFSDTWQDRALLVNDAVHLYHSGLFWSQDWQGLIDPPLGPK